MALIATHRKKGNVYKFVSDPQKDGILLTSDTKYTTLKKFFTDMDVRPGIVLDISETPHKMLVLNMAERYLYRFTKYNDGKLVRIKVYDTSFLLTRPIFDRNRYNIWTKDLINEPANIATPDYIARKIKSSFKNNVKVRVLNVKDMQREGLNLVIAVGMGSSHESRFVIMEHRHPQAKKTICLCGKGVTFDSGGTQIKTSNTYSMKGDKTGGCVVMGIVKYFSEIDYPCNLVGIVPLVHNIVSGSAMMPGDIVRSHSGKTVEVLDTDAEGRLILADALSYAGKYKPDYVFDFATLTGWASRLHCDTAAIVFTTNAKLKRVLEDESELCGERVWLMPPWLEYMQYCKSQIADLKNFDLNIDGCSAGGGFMASMFLAHFVHRLDTWVHFDICNNIDRHVMNANTMNLAINVIRKISQAASAK